MEKTLGVFKTVAAMVFATAVAAAVQVYVSDKVRKHINKGDKEDKAKDSK